MMRGAVAQGMSLSPRSWNVPGHEGHGAEMARCATVVPTLTRHAALGPRLFLWRHLLKLGKLNVHGVPVRGLADIDIRSGLVERRIVQRTGPD